MFLNQFLFFVFRSHVLVVWDYKNHRQYEFNAAYVKRLLEIVENPKSFDEENPMDLDLLNNGILLKEETSPEYWGWDDLSKIFHVGTKDIPCETFPKNRKEWADLYYRHCESLMMKPVEVARTRNFGSNGAYTFGEVFLEGGSVFDVGLNEALINRKTCRVFERKAVLLEDLTSILYLAFGYLKERKNDAGEFVPVGFCSRRSSPSGGGLNASEVYIYVGNVEGVASGIHYYNPDTHSLIFMCALPEALGEFLEGQHFINDIPFGVFLTSRFDKMWWKYEHSRAYRVSILDIGHLSQTFQLVATAAGLKTWLTAALTDAKIEKLLGLSGLSEQPMLFVGAGYSGGDVFSEELKVLLRGD
ncbi:SagB family peptide dehydrogenase [Pseudomonas neuropathica]|jgi:SagB-type dehydrogenase family enzyme|uniref:SagB family peptide dehydrogenase n=1 Tax=Pseudomonas neuropathica TaxID=2730425 RepID=A0ACC7MZ07_9PSED